MKFYAFFCAWNLWVFVCPLFLSLSWRCACKFIDKNKNWTTMWGLGLEYITLVSIVNHNGESSIVRISIFPRVFLQLGLKFNSDREDFLVEMYIYLSLDILRPRGRGEKARSKWNNISSVTILWVLNHPGSIVWMVVESEFFCYFRLGHSTVSE